jgi:hypothetical protein
MTDETLFAEYFLSLRTQIELDAARLVAAIERGELTRLDARKAVVALLPANVTLRPEHVGDRARSSSLDVPTLEARMSAFARAHADAYRETMTTLGHALEHGAFEAVFAALRARFPD